MVLNNYKKNILAEFIKDMYDARMTTYSGRFTDRANAIIRRLRGTGFCDFFTDSPLYLNGATQEEIVSDLRGTRVWILEAPNTDRWIWHRALDKDTTDEQFLEIINNNRQMYGLQKSSYTQSEMAKAARLLDDEMQYEI
jgi:hypothetical protein